MRGKRERKTREEVVRHRETESERKEGNDTHTHIDTHTIIILNTNLREKIIT